MGFRRVKTRFGEPDLKGVPFAGRKPKGRSALNAADVCAKAWNSSFWRAAKGMALLLAVSSTSLPSLALALPEARPESAADAHLAAYTADKPALAVLVTRGGKVIYERYLGSADLEHQVPLTAASRFHIASVSKQFTAFAILQLVRAGKIDLDADIHRYLPNLPDFGAKITVDDLVHHISGLRDQWDLEAMSGTSMESVIRQSAIVAMAENQHGLNFQPGTDYRYCNTGYSLLAEIVSRTAGMSFKEYMRQNIFAPLKMNDTLVYDDISELLPDRVTSYRFGPAGDVQLMRLNYATYGATSITTTARDLLRWSQELLHPTVFDPSLVRAAEQMGHLHNGAPLNYGYGMADQVIGGLKAFGHNGSDAGFRTFIASFPAQDATVIVLSAGSADVGRLADGLASDLLGGSSPAAPIAPPNPTQIAKLAGYYVDGWGPGLTLRVENGVLFFERGASHSNVKFLPGGDFYLNSASTVFHQDANGDLDELASVGGILVKHRKVERVTPSAAALASIEGLYRSGELDTTYRIKAVHNGLELDSLRSDPITFVAADADHFDSVSFRLIVSRDATGQVRSIGLSSGRIKDVEIPKLNRPN